MKEHYTLIFQEQPIRLKSVSGSLPIWCKKTLVSAQNTLQYDFVNGSTLIRQKLLLNPFYIELIQTQSFASFHFQYEIDKKRIFL